MSTTMTKTETIWQPTGKYLQCRVSDFMARHGSESWQELVARSTDDIEWFWNAALEYLGLEWYTPYSRLLDVSAGFAWTKWFVGGELNIYANCLDWHLNAGRSQGSRVSVGAEHPAIIWEGDDGATSRLSYGELHEMSSRVAAALLRLGIGAGDAVGIYMPMVPEVVAVLFGCLKIGAV